MEKLVQIQNKVNEVAIHFGFREFTFNADKYETAQRALSRFVKAMNNKISREEIENTDQIKLKLDLVSGLIKTINTAKFNNKETDKLEFILDNAADQLFEFHKNRLVKYFTARLPKELKFNYTIIANFNAYKAYAENSDAHKIALENIRNSNRAIFAAIKSLSETTLENLEEKITVKSAITKSNPELFNTKLVEEALTICQLHKEKIDEINKSISPKKKTESKRPEKAKVKRSIDLSKVKSNATKAAYTDTGAENNPFASLLDSDK